MLIQLLLRSNKLLTIRRPKEEKKNCNNFVKLTNKENYKTWHLEILRVKLRNRKNLKNQRRLKQSIIKKNIYRMTKSKRLNYDSISQSEKNN
jgi:hypothetical protein